MSTASAIPKIVTRKLHFLDVAEERNQRLPPIHGYEDKPLVSLEEAVKSVESLVPNVQRMVASAKEEIGASTENLRMDQAASIKLYTLESEPRDKSFFYILNQALRSEDRDKLKRWFLYLKLILTALEQLPSVSDTVYRGVKLDLSSEYVEGIIFTWWGFSSCTSSANVLESDQFLGTQGERTVFIIHCYSGKDIRKFSFYRNEFEVLLRPATRLRVIKCRKSIDLTTIELEELRSPQTQESVIISSPTTSNNEGYSNPALERFIQKHDSRSTITLHQRHLTDMDMWIVVEHALNQKQCNELYLTRNREITVDGVSVIALALKTNRTLVNLYLGSNPQISDDSAAELAEALKKNRTLKVLDLSQNSLKDGGAQHLAEMLTENKTLIELNLTNNQIHNRGVQYLATALAGSNKTLEILSLDWNPFADACINSLVDMLAKNRTLKQLAVVNSAVSVESKARLKDIGKERVNY